MKRGIETRPGGDPDSFHSQKTARRASSSAAISVVAGAYFLLWLRLGGDPRPHETGAP
jgi:hypothetical protein